MAAAIHQGCLERKAAAQAMMTAFKLCLQPPLQRRQRQERADDGEAQPRPPVPARFVRDGHDGAPPCCPKRLVT